MKLALITARGGSKRIPKKNIRDFCGRPIIWYSIQAAVGSGCFDRVIVSTDSPEIAEIAKECGAEVPFLRSQATSNDYATTADVIEEVLMALKKQGSEFELACCIYPTAPFVSPEVLRNGLDLIQTHPNAETVFPVTRFSFPIQRALKLDQGKVSMFYPEHRLSRSQDLEPAYHDAGQFYWLRVSPFLQDKSLYGANSVGLVRPESEVQDIDNEEDWLIAELKYKLLRKTGLQ